MYLRTVRAKGAEGVEFEYIRLVEAQWENGRSKQRVIANLGRKDLLAPHLESLIKLLGGGKRTKGSSATCAERIDVPLRAVSGSFFTIITTEVFGGSIGGVRDCCRAVGVGWQKPPWLADADFVTERASELGARRV